MPLLVLSQQAPLSHTLTKLDSAIVFNSLIYLRTLPFIQ
jgi:hypothetical protein